MSLRKWAAGKSCQVRISGVCNFNPETTVLAHIRVGGVAGMGMKPPDMAAVLACSACHDVIDYRTKTELTRIQLESHILHAMVRTLNMIAAEYKLVKK